MSDTWLETLCGRLKCDEAEFTHRVQQRIRTVCRWFGLQPADVEDLAQGSFLALADKFRTALPPHCDAWENVLAYAATVARHETYAFLKRCARSKLQPTGEAAILEQPTVGLPDKTRVPPGDMLRGLTEAVKTRLLELVPPGEHRDVLREHLNGRSRDEIAAQLGLSVSTVRRRLLSIGVVRPPDAAAEWAPYLTPETVLEILRAVALEAGGA